MYSLATRRLGAGRGRQRGAQSSLRFATSADDEICFLMSLPWLTKHRQSQQAHEMNFIGICCVILLYIFIFIRYFRHLSVTNLCYLPQSVISHALCVVGTTTFGMCLHSDAILTLQRRHKKLHLKWCIYRLFNVAQGCQKRIQNYN